VNLGHVFLALFGLALLYFLFQVIKNRGFRGAVFGAPVARTIGQLNLGRKGMVRTRLKVHRLEPREPSSPEIGIEVWTKTIGAFSIAPLPLTREQAVTLSSLLSQAAAEGANRG
jgi:hypothetical protein